MDKYKHTDPLVLQSAELTERTPFCPEDTAIAGFFDGQLADQERQNIEHHLADCRYCQARIGMLNRQQGGTPAASVPEETLAAAKALGRQSKPRRLIKAPAWAMAAVVLLGVFFVTVRQPASEPETRQLRTIERPQSRLEVMFPGPDQVIPTDSPIRWTEFPAGSRYTVYVLSGDGDVLWTERLQTNEWVLQNGMGLDPSADFFLRVEAELPDGRTLSSNHLSFRLSDR